MVMNQRSMMGPKVLPTFAVPRLCSANNATRIRTAIGMVYGLKIGVATFRPSTALRTEMAGVMMPSP